MRARGFTLIELVIIVAIIGIAAAVGGSAFNAMRRNAGVGAAAFELATKLGGERAAALADQKDHVVVVRDGVTIYFLQPSSTWTLGDFDPSHPDAMDGLTDWQSLAGIRFDSAKAGVAAPVPFGDASDPTKGARVLDPGLTTGCGGSCVAIRFRRDGRVVAEGASSAAGTQRGFAFGLTSAAEDALAADHKGVVIAFPSGIVKTFTL